MSDLQPMPMIVVQKLYSFTATVENSVLKWEGLIQGHGTFASMSENNGALLAPRPKRTVTASSKLVDPQNIAEPICSHKRAIELKRAAELANKQLRDAADGPPDSRTSRSSSWGRAASLSTLSVRKSTDECAAGADSAQALKELSVSSPSPPELRRPRCR